MHVTDQLHETQTLLEKSQQSYTENKSTSDKLALQVIIWLIGFLSMYIQTLYS